MSPKAGIVIRTFNEEAMLGRTLEAIAAQSERSFEVILVDSGSTDRTLEIARTFPGIRIIQIPKAEFTYGRALNVGIAACSPGVEYAVLLSAHAVPCHGNWLESLLSPMDKNPGIVGVYGKQIPHAEHIHGPVMRNLAHEIYPWCYGEEYIESNQSVFFSNVNAAIRKNWWDEFPYEETLPFCEDWAWCKVVQQAKGWTAYEPAAAVFHSHEESVWSYFNRFKNHARAEKLLAMGEYDRSGRILVGDIIKDTKAYILKCRQERKMQGEHFDRLITRTVQNMARIATIRKRE